MREGFHGAGLNNGRELRLFIVGEVSGGAVEPELADVRRIDLIVPRFLQFVGNEVLQFGAEDRAVGSPEHHAGSDRFIDVKEFEFAAEFAVIAGAGLFKAFKIFGQFFL